MLDQYYTYATAAVIVGLIGSQVFRKSFDPFAPIWMFVLGFAQVYVVQAISYRDWAVRVRGVGLVEQANLRALWALALFLAVYFLAPARALARRLPSAPARWSSATVGVISPVLIVWGTDDWVIPSAAAHSYHRRIPHSQLAIFEETGHVPQLERPARFNRLLGEFLNS